MAKSKKQYSLKEKRAYYKGFGVGITGSSYFDGYSEKEFVNLKNEKETASFLNGFLKGGKLFKKYDKSKKEKLQRFCKGKV